MSIIHVEQSHIVNAPPADVYAVISDYEIGHPAILPRPYFEAMIVEKGGQGAGTVTRLRMKVFGKTFHYHQIVSEPEPGRVLVEEDMDTGQLSRFILNPVNNGTQTRVTIESEFPASPGIAGFMERLLQPRIVGHIYRKELALLADYLEKRQS